MFKTLIHPTDFDAPSKEAFRVARSLAHALGARFVVFHVVPPPAVVNQDGRVILDPHNAGALRQGPHSAVDFGPDGAARRAKVGRRDGGLSFERLHAGQIEGRIVLDFGN